MKLTFSLRFLQVMAGVLWLALMYGACYDTLPTWRELHNRTMFRMQHDAVSAQASVVHVGAERHRKRYGYSTTPIFGIQYVYAGQTFIGFVSAHNSGDASDHSEVVKATQGKVFNILIDAHHPSEFYAQPNAASILQIFPNLFWYMILWAFVLTSGNVFSKWVQRTRVSKDLTDTWHIQSTDLKQFSIWIAMLGLGFWIWILVFKVVLSPWMPSSSTHIAQALQTNEGLLGNQWQRWQYIEYRLQDISGGGNQCANIGYVDSYHMQWEIRWRHEDEVPALLQIHNIQDTTYCNSALASNQSIELGQTDNGFARIGDGRNKVVVDTDGYDYTDATVTIVAPRHGVRKNELISIRLDKVNVARFPLYLYVW